MAGQTVAVVEDDLETLEMMGVLLEHEGYQTILWSDGKDAYDMLRRQRPDLVILDLRLGDDDEAGWRILVLMRGDPALRHTPAIMYSAHVDFLGIRERILRMKGCDVVMKPFRPNDLLAKIAAVFEPQPT